MYITIGSFLNGWNSIDEAYENYQYEVILMISKEKPTLEDIEKVGSVKTYKSIVVLKIDEMEKLK